MKGPVEFIAAPEMSNNMTNENDFSEFMWMADELEEFDEKCVEELKEQEFIEACLNELLQDDEDEGQNGSAEWYGPQNPHEQQLINNMQAMSMNGTAQQAPSYKPQVTPRDSSLNPNAPEFVPGGPKKTEIPAQR